MLLLFFHHRKSSNNSEENFQSVEQKRLLSLGVVLNSLAGDVHRLQVVHFVASQDRQIVSEVNTPLSTAVSRLKTGAKRRGSTLNRSKSNITKDNLKQTDSAADEKNRDIVFPLNSLLLT